MSLDAKVMDLVSAAGPAKEAWDKADGSDAVEVQKRALRTLWRFPFAEILTGLRKVFKI